MVAMAAVAAVAHLAGFRPETGPARWAAAAGLLAMLAFAFTWLAVALGMVAGSPETASNLPLPLMFLRFPGSGFVPTGSMPAGLREFAEHQPFTPVIDTVRALLIGAPARRGRGRRGRLVRRDRAGRVRLGAGELRAAAGRLTAGVGGRADRRAVSSSMSRLPRIRSTASAG